MRLTTFAKSIMAGTGFSVAAAAASAQDVNQELQVIGHYAHYAVCDGADDLGDHQV